MRNIPMSEMSIERLRVELQDAWNANKLLQQRVSDLETERTPLLTELNRIGSDLYGKIQRVEELEKENELLREIINIYVTKVYNAPTEDAMNDAMEVLRKEIEALNNSSRPEQTG